MWSGLKKLLILVYIVVNFEHVSDFVVRSWLEVIVFDLGTVWACNFGIGVQSTLLVKWGTYVVLYLGIVLFSWRRMDEMIIRKNAFDILLTWTRTLLHFLGKVTLLKFINLILPFDLFTFWWTLMLPLTSILFMFLNSDCGLEVESIRTKKW